MISKIQPTVYLFSLNTRTNDWLVISPQISFAIAFYRQALTRMHQHLSSIAFILVACLHVRWILRACPLVQHIPICPIEFNVFEDVALIM